MPAPVPIAEPALDRAALLLAAARAASAAATGEEDRESQRQLDGKVFEARLRFGCAGPTPAGDASVRGWSFDEKRRVLRLWFAAEIARDDPLLAGLVGDSVEAVEGFRIARPWALSAACPRVSSPPRPEAGVTPTKSLSNDKPPSGEADDRARAGSGRLVGIAQFFGKADARTHRRDHRPYEATRVLGADETPSTQGYDLVLSGRLKALADGRVIACRSTAADQPPSCIVSAQIDSVRLERGDTREQLAEWSGS
jgi:hypothetical protein